MTALASRSESAPIAAKPRGGAGHVLAPLAVAILAAAGVAALYRAFVLTSLGQYVDTTAMRGGDVSHPRVVEVLSRTLNGTTLISLVGVCLAAATIGVLRKRIDLAVGAALLVLGANGSCQLLKMRLDRPDYDGLTTPNSFPSGHTAAAASVAFALILVLPAAVRGMVTMIGAGYVIVIAIATVWAEWHRPSDTVAAILLVLAWSAFVSFVIRLRRSRHVSPAERHSRVGTVVLLIVTVVAGIAGVLGLVTTAMSERVSPDLVSGQFAFLAGSAGIAAAVAGAFLIWVRLASGDKPETAPAKAAVRRRSKGGSK
ncbi:membrane-associated phospholipid phosphatase [Actinoplanes tereljensis]|uniref:Phosphatidic acid phosphatase n=1 Tax=Paractinoplanes tereljensis TaxID=571912 RepID=A0A919U047_9ACTN|nr:phosphatase PAP2 family protein [Actinoplanes tereljensis]GIF26930.1 phosphatidic acid phosphatase [Actinoplanes tereljensis]